MILFGAIAQQGWLDLVTIQFLTFVEVDLPINSNDRIVWRFAQEKGMILLTANRRMKGKDSLEQVIREENTSISLPVITISNPEQLVANPNYRERCVESLIEIVLDVESYHGTRRIFIP